MGTPPDKEGQQGEGGWQSSWQQPSPGQGWEQPSAPPSWQQPSGGQSWQQPSGAQGWPQPATQGNWQQAPDGSWQQVGGTETSGKAITALVLGILGLLLCPLICSVLAVIFGYQARREGDSSAGRVGGRGIAVAGVVLGWIGLVIWSVLLILIVIGLAAGESVEGTPSEAPVVLLGSLV
jgi:hypothetical protein